ncbi:hypothetical protein CLOM_g17031 [Closterium sp. NIES-68]|nr:hypothetical protein CLOM_g17031 [Closterium sp. NIES-68]GJP80948.1 hypothetical protein CLOP_g11139 [Closterium sp. NIES-67]
MLFHVNECLDTACRPSSPLPSSAPPSSGLAPSTLPSSPLPSSLPSSPLSLNRQPSSPLPPSPLTAARDKRAANYDSGERPWGVTKPAGAACGETQEKQEKHRFCAAGAVAASANELTLHHMRRGERDGLGSDLATDSFSKFVTAARDAARGDNNESTAAGEVRDAGADGSQRSKAWGVRATDGGQAGDEGVDALLRESAGWEVTRDGEQPPRDRAAGDSTSGEGREGEDPAVVGGHATDAAETERDGRDEELDEERWCRDEWYQLKGVDERRWCRADVSSSLQGYVTKRRREGGISRECTEDGTTTVRNGRQQQLRQAAKAPSPSSQVSSGASPPHENPSVENPVPAQQLLPAQQPLAAQQPHPAQRTLALKQRLPTHRSRSHQPFLSPPPSPPPSTPPSGSLPAAPLDFLRLDGFRQPRLSAFLSRPPPSPCASNHSAVSTTATRSFSPPNALRGATPSPAAAAVAPAAAGAAAAGSLGHGEGMAGRAPGRVTVLQSGMVLLQGWLSVEQQQRFVRAAQDTRDMFRRPVTAGGGQYHLYSTCWGAAWSSTLNRYSAAACAPPIPPDLAHLAWCLALEAHSHSPVFWGGGDRGVERVVEGGVEGGVGTAGGGSGEEEEAGVLGRGTEGAAGPDSFVPDARAEELGRVGLGGHQDLDDSYNMPVVSVSVGDTMKFFFRSLPPLHRRRSGIAVRIDDPAAAARSALGDASRNRERVVSLASGDVLVFGAASRLVYHGTRALVPGTRPPGLAMTPGRLNFTFRVQDKGESGGVGPHRKTQGYG